MPVREEEQKLAELILYISQRCASHANFGQVKLQKILFFADFTAFGTWGETITQAEYQHLPQGPAVRRMLPVQAELKDENALAIQPTDSFGHTELRPVNLRLPDLARFSGREIALVDAWIDRLRLLSAREVSELSHETAGWRITRDGESIDPRSVYLAWSTPTAFEIQRGQQLAAANGLFAP